MVGGLHTHTHSLKSDGMGEHLLAQWGMKEHACVSHRNNWLGPLNDGPSAHVEIAQSLHLHASEHGAVPAGAVRTWIIILRLTDKT